jgi:AraC family transcriptional regulator of adaptative response / DNA-3-methyladenine glycosylase II
MAARAVIGQQVSVAGARTVLGRLTRSYGEPASDTRSGPRSGAGSAEAGSAEAAAELLFPDAATVAAIDPAELPMPRARGRTLVRLAALIADGEIALDPGADRDETRAALLRVPGIGPWTADYLRMRALGDPDVMLATDLGVRTCAAALGIDLTGGRPEWAPWRSYVTHHLWAAGSPPAENPLINSRNRSRRRRKPTVDQGRLEGALT